MKLLLWRVNESGFAFFSHRVSSSSYLIFPIKVCIFTCANEAIVPVACNFCIVGVVRVSIVVGYSIVVSRV